jgi:hypothetical protein
MAEHQVMSCRTGITAINATSCRNRSLQSGLGFLRHLIPDLPWVFLAVDFPETENISGEGRAYHVPRQSRDWLGLAWTPVTFLSTMQEN